jgi:hypothetical protein
MKTVFGRRNDRFPTGWRPRGRSRTEVSENSARETLLLMMG